MNTPCLVTWVLISILAASVPAAVPAALPAAAPATPDLARAVAAMRGVAPDKMTEDERKAKAQELDAAWKTLGAAGKPAADLLKAEIRKIDAAKEKDDLFKLGAAVVLWQIGKLDEAAPIAGLWSGDVDLAANYNYVFFLGFEAAQTQDPRVLPMLAATLKDRKGSVFIAQHFLTVAWPLTQEFLWGAFGSKGLPVLAQVLNESRDPKAQGTAVLLLARDQYLPSLSRVRQLAQAGEREARGDAIRALGFYGHPQDFDSLVAGLKSNAPELVREFVFALYEYEDLRAAPQLAALPASDDDVLRREACAALMHLVCPESLAALHEHSAAPAGAAEDRRKEADENRRYVEGVLKALDLRWEAWTALPEPQKRARLAALRQRGEEKYVLKPDDRKLTHDELLKAAGEWLKNGRITGGSYAWVEDRHVLAAASPQDIDLLVDVKGKCYRRLSDECLYETRTLDDIIRRLGRMRYRKIVGLTEKAENVAAPTAAPAGGAKK